MSSNSTSATSIMSASASAPAKTAKRVAKKTDDAPAVAAPAVTPKAAAVPKADAPAKETKPKATKAAAAPAVAADAAKATPAVATPVVAAPVVAAPAEEEKRLEAEVKEVTARLLSVRETLSGLITESKKLEKRAAKLQKLADKRKRKVRTEGEEGKPVKPSIFKVPTAITPALCAFMGLPAGSLESRANVSKYITTYVREHNLKDAKHGINPDGPLKKLLTNLKDGEPLTYFNLQKYLNIHYIKAAPATA